MNNFSLVEWYFILILFLPNDDIKIQQFGRFDSKADCQTVETLISLKMPSNYIRFDVIPCWSNTFKFVETLTDKADYEPKK